jgi:hypothetical protein
VQDHLPSVAVLSRTRFPLTLVGYDQMDLTAVADEHVCREDIEQIRLHHIRQSEVKVSRLIRLPNHHTPVRFGTTVIYNVIAGRSVEPSRLDLNLDE